MILSCKCNRYFIIKQIYCIIYDTTAVKLTFNPAQPMFLCSAGVELITVRLRKHIVVILSFAYDDIIIIAVYAELSHANQ